jgi:hypothetical protein
MRRKIHPKPEPVIAAEILEQAKQSISADRLKKSVRCSVCGADTNSVASEPLCWVCRRLKISAWRDVEQQMPAQE